MNSRNDIDPREILLSGWIGEHPVTGQDVAHLLLAPATGAITELMPLLADALGLQPIAGAPAQVDPAIAHVALEGQSTVRVLYGTGGELVRPITPEWASAALGLRMVMLTCGTQPAPKNTQAALDCYLATAKGLYMGLLSVMS
ncbi:hypothetical protein MOQ72_27060 [Saccharopolyspora sp. K220]|uniref:hypothetical protein n=1 Tax=Saccharopolyspora soli TaxID=2926618 RepID=UPI001F59E4AE|nr:hypothetical protein [Saccharopolyspora soli]MCI2421108.1 hypothetical protein [Saccharopolyspora soli]